MSSCSTVIFIREGHAKGEGTYYHIGDTCEKARLGKTPFKDLYVWGLAFSLRDVVDIQVVFTPIPRRPKLERDMRSKIVLRLRGGSAYRSWWRSGNDVSGATAWGGFRTQRTLN